MLSFLLYYNIGTNLIGENMAIQAIPALNLIGNVRAAQYAPAQAKPNFMQTAFSAENQMYNVNHPRHNGEYSACANKLDLMA